MDHLGFGQVLITLSSLKFNIANNYVAEKFS